LDCAATQTGMAMQVPGEECGTLSYEDQIALSQPAEIRSLASGSELPRLCFLKKHCRGIAK
jgi:hypothetical protein